MAELISQPTKINNNNFGAGAYIHIINNPSIWLHLLFDPRALPALRFLGFQQKEGIPLKINKILMISRFL